VGSRKADRALRGRLGGHRQCIHDAWRDALAGAVGTTRDRVAVHVVHQHDTPGVDDSTETILAQHGLAGALFDVEPAKEAIRRVADAAREAAEHFQRVTHVGIGRGKVEKVASNRRILGPDGKCIATRMSSCRDEATRAEPEGIVDPYVRLLTFWMANGPWRASPTTPRIRRAITGKGA